MTQTLLQNATRHRAKVVGIYYMLTIFMALFVLFFHGRLAFAGDLVAIASYIAITFFFYELSKPAVGKSGR
jgi:hypothetical protein